MAMESHKQLSDELNFINGLVDQQLAGKKFWLKAEISTINFRNSGHSYLELVEYEDGRLIVQCRGTIWSRAEAIGIRATGNRPRR